MAAGLELRLELMGLIVSTATSSNEALDQALDKIRQETNKPVALLIGADFASFLLRFGPSLRLD